MANDKKRILVVDDETAIRQILATRLSMGGYEVSVAADGEEALKVFSQDMRSEERRVGKECRSRWSPYH